MNHLLRILALAVLACALALGCRPATKSSPVRAGTNISLLPPVYQTSWATPAWWIDPASGSDANTCTSTTSPCKTYAQIAARWGTYAPRLRQATVVHFKSSQPDPTDPIILKSYIENGGSITIQCEPTTPLQTGALASVVPRAQSTGTLLTATIGAGGAINQFVQNTTHPSAAYIYKNSTGNAWSFTRPMVVITTFPYQWYNSGTPVDTWANGDAFIAFQQASIYLEDFEPLVASGNAVYGPSAYVNQCYLAGPANILVNGNVDLTQTSTDTLYNSIYVNIPIGGYGFYALNSSLGAVLHTPPKYFFVSSFVSAGEFVGGYVLAPVGSVSLVKGVIVDATFSATIGIEGGVMNDVYIASGTTLGIGGEMQVTGPVWGPGALNVQNSSRLFYPAAGGAAVANFLQTGFTINGASAACSHSGASPDVVSCGISLSAATLDAAQGAAGFGGLAYVPGGGSVSHGGF